jgi:hypothetical protein
MASTTRLATNLDVEMLRRRGVTVAPAGTNLADLPQSDNVELARQLCSRLLLRYVTPAQLSLFVGGSAKEHYVTPTPILPEEAVGTLALPPADRLRAYVLLIDPAFVPVALGPRWVSWGAGIEYVLPLGFPEEAVVSISPDAPGRWAIEVG